MKQSITLNEIKLVGIKLRTSNQDEFNPLTAKIGPCVQSYKHKQVADTIPHRKNPGTTFSVFAEYESDHTAPYSYFIGEEVTEFGALPDGLTSLVIPPQTYTKFTTPSGPMPMVVIEQWQKIWQMSDQEMGGPRRYLADFEIHDARTHDLQNAVVDVYIGVT